MKKFENLVKEYSSKKLKEIIEVELSSHNAVFIEYVKDELIRRGESLPFNSKLEKEITSMSDDELKDMVEYEWENFHLECLEIARKEYLKRNFINNKNDKEREDDKIEKRYLALRTISNVYSVFAWVFGILFAIVALLCFKIPTYGLYGTIIFLVIGAIIVLTFLGGSESIKVFVDIEENTRKSSCESKNN